MNEDKQKKKNELIEAYERVKRDNPSKKISSRFFLSESGFTKDALKSAFGANAFSKLQKACGDEPNKFGREKIPEEQIMLSVDWSNLS